MTDKLTFIFDHENPNWRQGPEYNEFYLKGVLNHMNHRLQTFGHVFLNEFLDAVGIDRTRSGQIEGWKTDGQGYVNIEMEPVEAERNTTPDIRLTVITDGNVLGALESDFPNEVHLRVIHETPLAFIKMVVELADNRQIMAIKQDGKTVAMVIAPEWYQHLVDAYLNAETLIKEK